MPTAPTMRKPAGRPPKIANPFRWHLMVNRVHRDKATERALREGHGDVTDVLRQLMADYVAGRIAPSEHAADEVAR